MSPTAIFTPGDCTDVGPGVQPVSWQGCTRGVAAGWVLGGLYRVLPSQLPGTHIEHNLASGPYPRPNEAYFQVSDEVSRIGSRIDLRLTSESTLLTLRSDPPDWSRDVLVNRGSDLRTGPSQTAVSNRPVLHVLLTVADVLRVSSKDWIRPPTCSQELHNG